MIRLGITGHQSIPGVAHEHVSQALERKISAAWCAEGLFGLTSLALGADQLFAELILSAGGQLHVVVPASRYESTFDQLGLRTFRALLARAAEVETLAFDKATEASFFAAGKRIVDLCDHLLAVWDGQPSRGLGGTADVVHYAQTLGREVSIIWPAGVAR